MAALPTQSHADKLIFNNGDTLSGTFIRIENGEYLFFSDMLGEVRAPLPIATVEMDEAPPKIAVAEPESPPPPKPPLPSREETPVLVTGNDGFDEPLPDPDPSLSEVWERRYKQFRTLADDNKVVQFLEASRDWFQKIIPQNWNGAINVALNIYRSTNEERLIDIKMRVQRRWEKVTLSLRGFYRFKESENANGVVTKNDDKYGGKGSLRYSINKRVFADYSVDYEKDIKRQIDHDTAQSFGIGYRVFDFEEFKFNLVPTLSATYREAPGQNEKWGTLVSIRNELEYKVNRIVSIEQKAYAGTDPGNDENYQYGLETRLILKVSKWINAVALYQTDFDNRVVTGSTKDEERLRFSIEFPF